METNNILLLLLVLVVLAVILVLFFTMKKKDSVVGVFSLDNNLPRTADAPLKINVLMHDTKNNKLKVNIDGKELTLFTSKLSKDDYKGTVLQSEKFTEQASTPAGQDDITILVSGDMLFYNQSPPVPASDSDKLIPSKCGYYFKNKGSKLVNLSGTYQKDKDDKTGLVIDMKDPVVLNMTKPTTFSYKLTDSDGQEAGGPFTGAIALYSPYISISLKDLNIPNWSSYSWMGILNVDPLNQSNPVFISGDLQNILYLTFAQDDQGNMIPKDPQVFTRQ
jgi:hypothetical protein